MSVLLGLRNRLKRLTDHRDTTQEFLLSYVDRIILGLTGKRTFLYHKKRAKRFWNNVKDSIIRTDSFYQIKDIKIPLLNPLYENTFTSAVFEDSFWSYVHCNDDYSEKTYDECDKILGEGLYGLVNDKVNVTVNPGDIVIDAGSWIGDFAAYASVKGATTYAFEPITESFEYLKKTAEMNGNIIPVKKGLSNENTSAISSVASSGSSIVMGYGSNSETEKIEVVRLDDFVRDNNLERVDFIKADIEGSERLMLAGAQETLRRFAPKLALCTYHLPDDPQVLPELILKANPKYNIVQKRMKLFASVPD